MDFGEALKWLKDGGKATRNAWQPYGQHLAVLDIGLCLVQPTRVGKVALLWQATGDDLLADDWLVATADGVIAWPDGTVA
ncbi:MW1434 family type I TA system toxin [Nonomuraea sp. NPDC050643]|uniref:Thoeris anti-defense Tad2 family protein n=1 Tax=Nonomuraea sp. NPDC050643 TaxID=3155660 RepID=UPI0033C2DA8B